MHQGNVLLGIALGDAFCFGLEFQDRRFLQEQFKDRIDFTYFRSYRKDINYYCPGDYSDDTSDNIAVMKLLMCNEFVHENVLLKYIQAEYDNAKCARRGNPRPGYGSIEQVLSVETALKEKALRKVKSDQAGKLHPGNAPVMRAIPFGLIDLLNIERNCRISASLTHPHLEAYFATSLIANTAYFLLHKNIKKNELFGHLYSYYLYFPDPEIRALAIKTLTHYKYWISEDFSEESRLEFTGPSFKRFWDQKEILGLPSDALRTAMTALYIIINTDNSFGALKETIYMGGDVDTLAAITLGISVGLYGLGDIPVELIPMLENSERIIRLGEDFRNCYQDYLDFD